MMSPAKKAAGCHHVGVLPLDGVSSDQSLNEDEYADQTEAELVQTHDAGCLVHHLLVLEVVDPDVPLDPEVDRDASQDE